MITRGELRKIHGDNLPLHILEQDYIQSLFLQELYDEFDSLAFKGGTYLKHAFGLDRFSEDLDFTAKESSNLIDILKSTASNLSPYGIEANIDKINESEISFTSRLRYRGPLYDGSDKSIGNIELEISKRDDIFLEPRWKRLFFDYPETRAVTVLGLQKEEILCEKLRALSTRNKGRDLYDVWFLFKQDVDINKELFEKKMKVVDQPLEVNINISKSEWNEDLAVILERSPRYEDVKKDVLRKLKDSELIVK
ncbi:MAG: nucleotidyl transferase AbiEii/AbiGii toxin family protein [Thermoplasmata archaeon]